MPGRSVQPRPHAAAPREGLTNPPSHRNFAPVKPAGAKATGLIRGGGPGGSAVMRWMGTLTSGCGVFRTENAR